LFGDCRRLASIRATDIHRTKENYPFHKVLVNGRELRVATSKRPEKSMALEPDSCNLMLYEDDVDFGREHSSFHR